MAHKTNPMLRKMELQIEAKYAALFHAKLNMAMQMIQDAACFAANDVLQMGPGRAFDFCNSVREYVNEMAHLMSEDQKDDDDFVYAKAKIDDRLKNVVGEENFLPWEVRYGTR